MSAMYTTRRTFDVPGYVPVLPDGEMLMTWNDVSNRRERGLPAICLTVYLRSYLWAVFPINKASIIHQSILTTRPSQYPTPTMKFFIILASSFCCASAFGLHAATSTVKNVAYGFTKSKPMVQPLDLSGRVATLTNARDSMVRFIVCIGSDKN